MVHPGSCPFPRTRSRNCPRNSRRTWRGSRSRSWCWSRWSFGELVLLAVELQSTRNGAVQRRELVSCRGCCQSGRGRRVSDRREFWCTWPDAHKSASRTSRRCICPVGLQVLVTAHQGIDQSMQKCRQGWGEDEPLRCSSSVRRSSSSPCVPGHYRGGRLRGIGPLRSWWLKSTRHVGEGHSSDRVTSSLVESGPSSPASGVTRRRRGVPLAGQEFQEWCRYLAWGTTPLLDLLLGFLSDAIKLRLFLSFRWGCCFDRTVCPPPPLAHGNTIPVFRNADLPTANVPRSAESVEVTR